MNFESYVQKLCRAHNQESYTEITSLIKSLNYPALDVSKINPEKLSETDFKVLDALDSDVAYNVQLASESIIDSGEFYDCLKDVVKDYVAHKFGIAAADFDDSRFIDLGIYLSELDSKFKADVSGRVASLLSQINYPALDVSKLDAANMPDRDLGLIEYLDKDIAAAIRGIYASKSVTLDSIRVELKEVILNYFADKIKLSNFKKQKLGVYIDNFLSDNVAVTEDDVDAKPDTSEVKTNSFDFKVAFGLNDLSSKILSKLCSGEQFESNRKMYMSFTSTNASKGDVKQEFRSLIKNNIISCPDEDSDYTVTKHGIISMIASNFKDNPEQVVEILHNVYLGTFNSIPGGILSKLLDLNLVKKAQGALITADTVSQLFD